MQNSSKSFQFYALVSRSTSNIAGRLCMSVCPSVCTLHLQHYSSDMDWIYCSFPWVATAGIHWTTSAFGGDPRRMLIAIQSFICHLQGEHVLVVSGSLPYIMLPKRTNQCMLILKVTTAVFAETLDKFQHWTLFVSESRSYTEFVVECLY
jgi:hypothetical protein